MTTKQWVKNALDFNEDGINKLYSSELGLNFLLVWTIFERDCFNNSMIREKIPNFATEISQKEIDELLEFYIEFKNRYVNRGLFRRLRIHNEDRTEMNRINRSIFDITNINNSETVKKDIIYYLTYIVYRYRNNMFHGSKEASEWLERYNKQINDCIEIMKILVDLKKNSR